tara:strand:+ start:45441 stop:45752 length:312 start_codon:yes stop_codon:yes gene_type:complete
MNKQKVTGYASLELTGYISIMVGVVLLVIAIVLYQMYSAGNLMLETFICVAAVCYSRADIFCPAYILGFLLISLGLTLIWPYLSDNRLIVKILKLDKKNRITS